MPLTGLPARRGILRSLSGVPLANEEIVVTAGNRKVRTFTDARGEYRIFEALPGALEVQVAGRASGLPLRMSDWMLVFLRVSGPWPRSDLPRQREILPGRGLSEQ